MDVKLRYPVCPDFHPKTIADRALIEGHTCNFVLFDSTALPDSAASLDSLNHGVALK